MIASDVRSVHRSRQTSVGLFCMHKHRENNLEQSVICSWSIYFTFVGV